MAQKCFEDSRIAERHDRLICVALFALTLAVFSPALLNGFVGYDDQDYVTANRQIQQGLTARTFVYAFGSSHAANWHPLTWLSHALDFQIYGYLAWGHHLTSILLHAANAALLYVLLRNLRANVPLAAGIVLFFALHPLRVESVAWVSERKDVLSTFFALGSLIAYAKYRRAIAEEPASAARKCFQYYGLSLLLFALGLLSKPMVITLPCVLLLLDFWPFAIWSRNQAVRLLVEKLPFFALSCALAVITVVSQKKGGAMENAPPLSLRLENAAVAYWRYIGHLIWPMHLHAFYPPVRHWLPSVVLASALGIMAISIAVFAARKTRPWFFVGWFWFIGTLTPVIGIVHAGDQSMADRYSYIPTIGLLISAGWEVYQRIQAARACRISIGRAATLIGIVLLFGLCIVTIAQTRRWRDTETLFTYILEVAPDNYVAHNNLGTVYDQQGKTDAAIAEFQKSVEQRPGNALAYKNLGVAYSHAGLLTNAMEAFRAALKIQPEYGEAWDGLGITFTDARRPAEAMDAFKNAISTTPDSQKAHYDLATTLASIGRRREAETEYEKAIQCDPSYPQAHNNLGSLLMNDGNFAEAIKHFQDAIRLNPAYAKAYYNLGVAMAQTGRTNEAIAAFTAALEIQPDYGSAKTNLAILQGAMKR
jgi:tetratricopeptide (TPR) repeat protein